GSEKRLHFTEKNLTQRTQRTERREEYAGQAPDRVGTSSACPTNWRKKADRLKPILLAGEAVFFRIEQLGEARVFLEERKIFVVARVIAIFRAQLNRHL